MVVLTGNDLIGYIDNLKSQIPKDDSQGFNKCKDAAQRGGKVAGNARKETEKELGRPVVSKDNYLKIPEKEKRKQISKK